MNEMLQAALEWFKGINPLVAVAVISALPVVELRAGIPFGMGLQLPVWQVVGAALVGNALVVTPVVWAAKRFQGRLERGRWTGRIIGWSVSRARKHEAFVNRYGALGLVVLVAIPLPGTGAWTATAVSILVGMRMAPTLGAIYVGLAASAAIVTAVCAGVIGGAAWLLR